MGKLVLYMPDGSTREILLNRERIRIGRRPDNDVPLPFPAVSGEHAAIVTILSDSFLEDLGSTNGTFVNGKPITKHFLRDKDRIDVGRENFIYYADDAATPEALAPALLNSRNLAQSLESYKSIEAEIVGQIAARVKRVTKSKPTAGAPSIPASGEEVSDRTTRLKPVGVSAPVPPLSKDAPPGGEAIDTRSDDEEAVACDLFLRVLTGPSEGRELPLAKDVQSIGRIGVGVATLKRVGEEIWLIPLEGPEAPRHRGSAVPSEGAPVAPGDTFEVAGSELRIERR